MSFPDTRHTLIRRIAAGGDQTAWREFLDDYWEPICRFAAHRGNLNRHDAEDVASLVFEACLRNRLLERWADAPVAKLRTLICTVVRNVLSNRGRVLGQRARLLTDLGDEILNAAEPSATESDEQADIFYAAWADERLRSAVESLLVEYNQSGRGDYFRVLYARLCEELPISEIAGLLGIKSTSAENYFRHARQRLLEKLQEIVRVHVRRYSPAGSEASEFQSEWNDLGEHLQEHGGVEKAVRRAYHDFDPASRRTSPPRIAAGTLPLTAVAGPISGPGKADSA